METEVQTCYRHPDRPAGIVCQRCDRPICPACMHQASVGFHCPECTKAGSQKVYQGIPSLQARPIVTQVLVGINLVVFALGVILYGSDALTWASTGMHQHLGLVAKLWERPDGLYRLPVPGSTGIGVGEGQWYRIVTAAFLHYGLIHIALNMYALWILGPIVEQAVGRLRMALIYGVSLLGGSFGALLLSPQSLTAGASGAIFGLMGALLLAYWAAGVPWRSSPIVWILVLNLVITFGISGISVGGHVGGLVAGTVAGWLVFDLARRPGTSPALVNGLLVAVGVALAVGSVVFASGYQPTF